MHAKLLEVLTHSILTVKQFFHFVQIFLFLFNLEDLRLIAT